MSEPTTQGPLLLTVRQAREYLGADAVSRDKLYFLVSTGVIPSVRIGRQYAIPRVALDEFATQVARKPQGPWRADG